MKSWGLYLRGSLLGVIRSSRKPDPMDFGVWMSTDLDYEIREVRVLATKQGAT